MVNTDLQRLRSACSQYNHNRSCTILNKRSYCAKFTSEIANMNKRVEFRIERKRIRFSRAEVYEEFFGPFRPVVRTSSFHVEDTGSIPVRDRYLFPAGGIIAE
jgi:hypothetical protein